MGSSPHLQTREGLHNSDTYVQEQSNISTHTIALHSSNNSPTQLKPLARMVPTTHRYSAYHHLQFVRSECIAGVVCMLDCACTVLSDKQGLIVTWFIVPLRSPTSEVTRRVSWPSPVGIPNTLKLLTDVATLQGVTRAEGGENK